MLGRCVQLAVVSASLSAYLLISFGASTQAQLLCLRLELGHHQRRLQRRLAFELRPFRCVCPPCLLRPPEKEVKECGILDKITSVVLTTPRQNVWLQMRRVVVRCSLLKRRWTGETGLAWGNYRAALVLLHRVCVCVAGWAGGEAV